MDFVRNTRNARFSIGFDEDFEDLCFDEGNTRNAMMAGVDEEEAQDENSLYNFKLVGLISGKDHSYISLANSSGEVITLTLGQHLGKIKLVDLRLTEAIFQKDDEKFMIIDFNGGIRESDEY